MQVNRQPHIDEAKRGEGKARTFRVTIDGRELRTATVPGNGKLRLEGLPEGIIRIVDETAGKDETRDGWIYVTRWPSEVSGGNCRFSFDVPRGRYRLHGWHPYGGELVVNVDKRGHNEVMRTELEFGGDRPR